MTEAFNFKNMNKHNTIHPKIPTKHWWTKTRIITIVLSAFVILILYELFGTPANIRFYSVWRECGQKPVAVMVGTPFGGGVPHYVEPLTYDASRSYPPNGNYYCSPRDAEMHGYSANPERYEFEHTTDQERYNSYLQQKNQ